MTGTDPPWLMAACYRSTHLALVLAQGSTILAVERHRIRQRHPRTRLADLLASFARDYGVTTLLVEPDGPLVRAARRLPVATAVHTLPLDSAKVRLLGSDVRRVTYRALYRHLLAREPQLRRFATILPVTGDVATSDRWGMVTLLAAALAVAGCPTLDSPRDTLSHTSRSHF
jgi:hypothetical protein